MTSWTLDRKGLVIPGTDVVIPASADMMSAVVLTSDAHLMRIEGLRVIAPPKQWFS